MARYTNDVAASLFVQLLRTPTSFFPRTNFTVTMETRKIRGARVEVTAHAIIFAECEEYPKRRRGRGWIDRRGMRESAAGRRPMHFNHRFRRRFSFLFFSPPPLNLSSFFERPVTGWQWLISPAALVMLTFSRYAIARAAVFNALQPAGYRRYYSPMKRETPARSFALARKEI